MNSILNNAKALGAFGTITGAAFLAQFFIYTVQPGERAIIFNQFRKGISEKVYGEGLHFYIPHVQKVIKYNVRIQNYEHPAITGTKDLQKVMLKITLYFRPVEKFLPKIHIDLDTNYHTKILPAIGNEVAKAVVARYNAESLLKNREKIGTEIKDQLMSRAKNYFLILEDVAISELKFSKEFMNSIEKKQVAQQEAEMYKFVVMQKEQEKLAKIIESEGNSIAAKMISESVLNNGEALIKLRQIEASKHIAQSLSNSKNVGFIPFQSNMLLNLNN